MFSDFKNLKPSELEEEILKFWQDNRIFEKSLRRGLTRKKAKSFVFFDGPPFATGLPHYGHILASIIKDVIPRYQTMKGKRVERRWGWDCHGLPIENEIEKDLGLKTKKDIENIGIKTFNEAARKKVLTYAFDWKKIIPRIGRWIDMENDYKTMDVDYMESVLWVFKKLYDKGLVYNAFRAVPYCPRCGTSLSNFELNQPGAYKDVEDQSVYVKFEILNSGYPPNGCETNSKSQKSKTQNLTPKTYFLVWTTTPWTLPANAALAVGSKINYVRVKIGKEKFVLAKERLSVLNRPYEIEGEFLGKDLVGLRYEPLYKSKTQNLTPKTYQIVAADFVSSEDGTGIVHIAPAFGEDDMKVGHKENLPTIITVDREGKIIKDLNIPGEGFFVKKADEEIKANLKNRGLLYKEEKITHSYPHCWRCETPLLYYPINAWYIAVTKIKNQLIKNNQKINWIPSHIKNGRFGKWLEETRDWDVSRSRFWGSPIPVWKCEKCGKIKVVGSIEDIKKNIKKSGNVYFMMRHGEAEQNIRGILNSKLETNHYRLTEKGKKQVLAAAKKIMRRLAGGKIDIIFSSDLLRAKETSEMIVDSLKIGRDKIFFDKRVREVNFGTFDGKTSQEYRNYFSSYKERFEKNPPVGENFSQLKNRVSEFLYDIDKKYSNKNILIVSHEAPIWCMAAGAIGADINKTLEIMENKKEQFIKTGEFQKLDFAPIPHNENFELDLHRPYIDEIEFNCSCGGRMSRISDVFDCWFESGSMPYAQSHYPFERHFSFPAEFIAEGIDQTRGWFYTLLVLSTALFNKSAYKNVIVNGMVLAENGQKMAKHLKNYSDPMEVINKYGADALRYYLLSSSVMRAEDLNFSEKGVDEIYKKVILRLWNVYRFYDLYADRRGFKTQINADNISVNPRSNLRKSASVLDKWILARLEELKSEASKWLDKYEIDKAVQPIGDFVDDLSTWYIRRSRDRFTARRLTQTKRGLTQKELEQDKQAAILTTRFVLIEFSKIIAPFMPFISEVIYQQLKAKSSKLKAVNSVHLEKWPTIKRSKVKGQGSRVLLKAMAEVRRIASLALEARAKAGIKVRQPLASLKLKTQSLKLKANKELLNILADEINVKEAVFDNKINPPDGGEIELDIKITAELRQEGILREFTRIIQDLRKEAGYTPKDKIYLWLEAPKEIESAINKYLNDFKEKIGAKNIEFKRVEKFDVEKEIQIDGQKIWTGIKRI